MDTNEEQIIKRRNQADQDFITKEALRLKRERKNPTRKKGSGARRS